jgi:hypothetical protein
MIVSRLSANHSETLRTKGKTPFTPSLDTDQQVDIELTKQQDAFRVASLARSERWKGRTPNKREIVKRLHRLEHPDADKLEKCCSKFVVTTCGVHTTNYYPTYRCKKIFCPDCASARASRLSRQTEAKIGEVMKKTPGRLCFLT